MYPLLIWTPQRTKKAAYGVLKNNLEIYHEVYKTAMKT